MKEKIYENYFFFLISIIPISIILGSTISLLNILLLGFSSLIVINYKKSNFYKDISFKILIIIYLYLIFNSLISLDFSLGFKRNFGFIRYIFLFLAINYAFFKYPKFRSFFIIWLLISLVVVFDIYFEKINGTNLLGYGWSGGYRIVSFFKNEPIVGGFIFSFYLMILGYLFENYYEKKFNLKKLLIFSFLFLTLISIFITGERSNTIKAIFALFIFFGLTDKISFKQKVISILIFFIIFSGTLYYLLNPKDDKKSFLQYRYGKLFLNHFKTKESTDKFLRTNIYIKIYKSGIEVFKNDPILGVGNKNYRHVTCKIKKSEAPYICQTHPHQIFIEFLAEHGLFGSIILLGILFFLLFKILKEILITRNSIQIACFSYLISIFLPLLPSGSFFSNFNSTIFWLVFSIMYACNKNTNIFFKNKLS